jgi:hypothetical protein
VTLATEEE